ncbi:MAG TPA: helix-turn-helix domain-containing protein [Bacteroidota bacterium]|nr:helix-turn-helix domain-containing protein [Bacteroidota bacterium]
MEFIEELASIIRFHRKRAGLTQAGLAKLAGVGKTAVFDVEKGKKTTQIDTLGKILRVLNIGMGFTGPLMEEYRHRRNTEGDR